MKNLFVSCPYGFEDILRKELEALQVGRVSPSFCGVFIPGSQENVFKANYLSRVATRVLYPLTSFRCLGKDDLYKHSKEIRWDLVLNCKKTFAIDANVRHRTLTNSLFAAMVVKDALCDFFREKTGERPSVDVQTPDVQLNLFIQKENATIYLDTSGAPLHKRGWRESNTEATLHESLAAGLLLLTGYTEDAVFCDPFAGSGTFLVEAGLIATRTPPGFLRKKWGFFHMPGFDKETWQTWKALQDAKRIPLQKGKIFGSDKSREVSDICLKHLQKARLDNIEVSYDPISLYKPKIAPDFLLTNPPYGKRLTHSSSLLEEIGSFVQNQMRPERKAYILYPEAVSLEGLRVEQTFGFKNGGLEVKLLSLI